METLSPPPAIDLSKYLYHQVIYTLTRLLPPPIDDSPTALLARNHTAIAKVAALLPVGANELDLAAECIAAAREEAGRAVETLFNDFLRQTFEMLMPPGYTSMASMKNFVRNRAALRGDKLTAEALIDSGTALIGSPKTVLAGIERMRERTGFGILVAMLQFGILSDELTRRNMDLFAAEVMPHLRDRYLVP